MSDNDVTALSFVVVTVLLIAAFLAAIITGHWPDRGAPKLIVDETGNVLPAGAPRPGDVTLSDCRRCGDVGARYCRRCGFPLYGLERTRATRRAQRKGSVRP